ncbi:MAG TPA: alpha/beta hydrolase domain-containing protein [Burkholderiales bacterium]|nr:alpha/beta hydrolase domain-containing protein [Burkholderiales bacterium]
MKKNAVLAAALAAALAAPIADARVTRIEILQTERPTFGGFSWPGVGQYEKIVGIAHAEVNPADPRNAVIVDLNLAETNSRGNVEYSFNFYILKPIDLSKGAHRVMYEPPNRGGKTWSALGRVQGGGNDPGTITNPTVLANSFLMPRGYTLVWSGWEELGPLTSLTASASFPIVKNRDGSPITGPSYEYIVTGGASSELAYPAANAADLASAKMTRRVHLDDAPTTIPAWGSSACTGPTTVCWDYNVVTPTAPAGTEVRLRNAATGAGVNFVNNDIYEFSYTAKDPSPKGLGFAAVRDWMAWLRYETQDDDGKPNPLAGDIQKVYTEISSQPGRMFNDFRHLGFNEAENGKKVFDGHMQWIAAGNGINMNYRFSQTGRTERNRQNHLYIEGRFPFANVMSHDPITRTTDSRYSRCEQSNTCALGVEIYSANEYWVKSASLLHTDPTGSRDLPDSPYTRNYLVSSMQHGTGNPANRGACQQFQNPLNSAPIQRALFIALDDWATNNRKPPESQVPRLKDGTLAPPLPQEGMGFPNIPGVTYTGLKTTRYHFDYGPNFYETGIMTINPPVITVLPGTLPSSPVTTYQDNPANGPIYPSFVPTTDSDGNDIAGVRLPDVTVPLATYTGWALRSGVWANDGCEAAGQYIPFAATEAQRGADPRPSVAARYATFNDYYAKVVKAIDDMVAERTMLCEDAQSELNRLVTHGLARGVPAGTAPATQTFPHCVMERAGRSDHFKSE